MDTTGPERIKAIGAAWQRTVGAAKNAAAQPPKDATTPAATTPQEGK